LESPKRGELEGAEIDQGEADRGMAEQIKAEAEIVSGRGEQISRGETDQVEERQVGSKEGQIRPRWLKGAELGRRVPDQGQGGL
jgi:hypothetical protein